MNATANQENYKLNLFEKVSNPKFSLLTFKRKIEGYTNKKTLIDFAKEFFFYFHRKPAAELLDDLIKLRPDILESERIIIEIEKIIYDLNSLSSDNTDRRIITALRVIIKRLGELCSLNQF